MKRKAKRSGGGSRRAKRRGVRRGGGGGFSLRGLIPAGIVLTGAAAVGGAWAANKYWQKLPGDGWKGGDFGPLLGATAVGLIAKLAIGRVAGPAVGNAVLAGAIATGGLAWLARRQAGGGGSSAGSTFSPVTYQAPALPAPTGGGSTGGQVGQVLAQILSRIPMPGGSGVAGLGAMNDRPTAAVMY